MIEITALAVLVILGFRALVVLINLITRQQLSNGNPTSFPHISVLIPARNEEATLPGILEHLQLQEYPHFEVIVYDDASTDSTASIAEKFAGKNRNFCVISSSDGPPEGWLGKNHACHLLAQNAAGEYLLFLDADVRVERTFLKSIIAHSLKHKLHLFSLFPVQIMKTTGERLLVPHMNRILVSLLPLILTRISRLRSLSAANGQAMLFRADTYRKHWFHKMVRSITVEDIRIFRVMKRLRLKSHTMLSGGQISCRMYTGFNEALNGFSKNIFQFFGSSILLTLLYSLTTILGWVPVLMTQDPAIISIWCFLSLWTIISVSILSRQSAITNLMLSIPQQVALLALIINAFQYKLRGGYRWKGREVKV